MNLLKWTFAFVATLVFSTTLFAKEPMPGCKEAREFLLLSRLTDDFETIKQMRGIKAQACANGYRPGDTIRYANGETATLWAGREGATWNWPNGKTITLWAGRKDATWYYPNGTSPTLWAYKVGATWNYPNGKTITLWAGKKDATYYRADGSVANNWGPEFILEDGTLDLISFLEYVEAVQGINAKNPTASSNKEIGKSISDLNLNISLKSIAPQSLNLQTESLQRSEDVYCAYYSNSNTHGYSLYRSRDRQDLGNAVWTSNDFECYAAASTANYERNGLVCGRYHNSTSKVTMYSVYRIWDNQDLGKAMINDFELCQSAVRSEKRGIFCSTYVKDNTTWWSMYDVHSGADLGTQLYATLERCMQEY